METDMTLLDTLTQRNTAFAAQDFTPDLKMLPSLKTLIIGCVDPRVDPMDIFQLEPGEAVVIRNVGGRVSNDLLDTLELLRTVSSAAGKPIGEGWNLIVLHHTDCGIIGCSHHAPELLAHHLDVSLAGLDDLAISDPHEAVAHDVAALKADPRLPAALTISGLVYDVATGRIDTIVPPSLVRPAVA
jgi:carbonic anhydrase